MDRAKICGYLKGPLDSNNCSNIIKEYCIENGKSTELTDLFIRAIIIQDPFGTLLYELAQHILDKESIRLTIVKIYNTNKQLIEVL